MNQLSPERLQLVLTILFGVLSVAIIPFSAWLVRNAYALRQDIEILKAQISGHKVSHENVEARVRLSEEIDAKTESITEQLRSEIKELRSEFRDIKDLIIRYISKDTL